ncbi:MAG: hypothetical protein MK213_06170 [Planctomycetes bacterium]|nr:hypothetical protein [Planctomycetota bacterium]
MTPEQDPREGLLACNLISSERVGNQQALGRFVLEPMEGFFAPFQGGQACPVVCEENGNWKSRWFAVASDPGNLKRREFLVSDPSDAGDTGLFSLPIGGPVWVGDAVGSFTLDRSDCQHVVLLATGTGVAPYRAMLEEIAELAANQKAVPSTVVLIYGARSFQELAFLEDFSDLVSRQPFRFIFLPCVSGPEESPPDIARGRATDIAATLLGLPPNEESDGKDRPLQFPQNFQVETLRGILPEDDTSIFLCGSPEMIDGFETRCEGSARKEHLIFDRWW